MRCIIALKTPKLTAFCTALVSMKRLRVIAITVIRLESGFRRFNKRLKQYHFTVKEAVDAQSGVFGELLRKRPGAGRGLALSRRVGDFHQHVGIVGTSPYLSGTGLAPRFNNASAASPSSA